MSRTVLSTVIVLAIVAVAAAGGPNQQGADPDNAFQVSGTVTAVLAGFGSGLPVILVQDPDLGEVEVGLAPIWYLEQEGFSVRAGDEVSLLAFSCPTCSANAVAIWVDNLDTGVSIVLRDDDGAPVWTGRGANGGEGGGPWGNPQLFQQHCSSNGADTSSAITVTGVVESFTGASGQGAPVLVLTVDGEALELVASPYWAIDASGLDLAPGTELEVTYAPVECDGTSFLVTLSITHLATGITVQLRDPETGFPLTGGNGSGQQKRRLRHAKPTAFIS